MLPQHKARKFLNVARTMALEFSKDKSTKVGALVTSLDGSPLSWGYNGLPRGVNDWEESRHLRPEKYLWAEHAERNAIYNAARAGISLLNSRMFITHLAPCPDCIRGIIQAGVKEVYVEADSLRESEGTVRWLENWKVSCVMLLEAGVSLAVID